MRSRPLNGIILATFGLLTLLLGATIAGSQELPDRAISDEVFDELVLDQAIQAERIAVETDNGIVTLTGRVSNILAKDRATTIAETVKGVRAVVNEIDVDPAVERSDEELEDDVAAVLAANPATDTYELVVSADRGVVRLSGPVSSRQEKQLASKVAKSVRGVTEIRNDVVIDYAADRPDEAIKEEIEQVLRWDVLVDDALIAVEVDGGEVSLIGTVGSAAEKTQAFADAWVAGVESVDTSGLEVKKWARDEDLRAGKFEPKTDQAVREAVETALLYDPRVLSTEIEVEASEGVVTLRGTVESVQARRAAAADARNTVGVLSVENRLKVSAGEDDIADGTIAQDVRAALGRHPYVERYEIDVDVIDGTVYLSGSVDSYFERAQADDAASKVTGVVTIDNNIVVEDVYEPLVYDPYADDFRVYDYDWYDYQPGYTFAEDEDIEAAIKDELWWSPFVDSDEVTVEVENGVATLTGSVDTWSERSAARENAYEGGATWVVNDLNVVGET